MAKKKKKYKPPRLPKPGKEVLEWFIKLFDSVILIGSLGAGFTFTVILSPFDDETKITSFSAATINSLVAISWLLFVLALASASVLSSGFAFQDQWLIENYDECKWRAHLVLALSSALVQTLVVGGFMLLSLAVTAFNQKVGHVALAFTSFFTLLVWFMLGVHFM